MFHSSFQYIYIYLKFIGFEGLFDGMDLFFLAYCERKNDMRIYDPLEFVRACLMNSVLAVSCIVIKPRPDQ